MTHRTRTQSRCNHRRGLGRWIFLAIALLVGGLLAAVSQGQPAHRGHHGKGFGHGPGHGPGLMLFGADENDDGALSTDELNSFLSTLDANGDGILTQEEFRALHEARAAEAGIELPDEPGPRGDRMFEHVTARLDANEDGLIQTSEVVAHFNELDTNGDGSLTGDELPMHGEHGMRQHHAAIGMALRAADVDDDGNITTSEWTAFLNTVDEDGDGQITFEEVRRQADPDFEPPSVSIDQANELFNNLDANGDGTVSEDELPSRRGPRGPRGRGI